MRSNWALFLRLIIRPLTREPVRTALIVFAVALGVGVVIAINLAGQAAAGSFRSSLESLAGKSDLEITGTGGINERLLGSLVQLPYAFDFSPRIEDFAFLNGKGEALPFLGLDLIGHGIPQQGDTADHFEQLWPKDPIWVGTRLGLKRGERVRLLINDEMHVFTVAGVLKASGEGNAIVADIGLAQQVTRKNGKLDAIDVRIPPDGSIDHWRAVVKQHVPASLLVEPQGSRTQENRKMLAAFRWNLQVLSYIALVVGAFLIYNTISISVVRRRNEIGVVRALGGTRRLVTTGFLLEAMFFAICGSALGVAIGRLLAIGAVALIGSTVQSLYVSSEPAPIQLTISSALAGSGMGIAVAILAALAPAVEAGQVAPVEAMARGREEYVIATYSRAMSIAAAVMLLMAIVFSRLPPINGAPVCAYAAALLFVAAAAVWIPQLVSSFAPVASRISARLAGAEALLAMRGLQASIGRTSVLIAALATAVAMTAAVGIMVGSFRETVQVWMNNQLKADFYLRPAGMSAADRHPTISAEIADRIERLPGVSAVDRFRAYPITYEGMPATLAGDESSRVRDSSSTRFLQGENADRILAELPKGNYAVVTEPFANKHHIRAGGTIRLRLPGGIQAFKVLGIYYDYSTERGFIVLDRRTLLKYLPDPGVSNLAVYLKPGADANRVRREIDSVIGGRAVLVFSNRTLRRGAIAIFDRTFRITYALEAVAMIVAVMGIAGAMLAMTIDRRREFALLRFLGAAQDQVRRIILCEAGLLGLFANGIGLALGTVLSLLLVFVINKQSFGWTIQFHWPVALLLGILTVVYIATVLAGLYPARTAIRMNPIEVIHDE